MRTLPNGQRIHVGALMDEVMERGCTACSGKLTKRNPNNPACTVAECTQCGGVHGIMGALSATAREIGFGSLVEESEGAATRYFDMWVSQDGLITRSHGWYDPERSVVVQYG